MGQNLLFILLITSTFFACAKEQTEEERTREKRDRELERIIKTEGSYNGTLESESIKIPMNLTLAAQKTQSSTSKDPHLTATATLGLFGGVKITTENTIYDHGTGEVIAKFQGQGASSSDHLLELKGHISKEEFTGQLTGAKQGMFDVKLSSRNLSLVSLEKEYQYNIYIESEEQIAGQLVLKRLNKQQATTEVYDLPQLPSLTASFQFVGLSSAPILASDVRYDPLSGTLEANINTNSLLTIHNISNQTENEQQLKGEIEINNNLYAHLTLKKEATVVSNDQLKRLPKYFIGQYQGKNSQIPFNAIATLDLQGKTSQNTDNMALNSFPTMTLNLTICLGNTPYKQFTYQAFSLDHIKRSMKLEELMADKNIIEMEYDVSFADLSATVTTSQSNPDAIGSYFNLSNTDHPVECSEFNQ